MDRCSVAQTPTTPPARPLLGEHLHQLEELRLRERTLSRSCGELCDRLIEIAVRALLRVGERHRHTNVAEQPVVHSRRWRWT
jgi:hypothetical protein